MKETIKYSISVLTIATLAYFMISGKILYVINFAYEKWSKAIEFLPTSVQSIITVVLVLVVLFGIGFALIWLDEFDRKKIRKGKLPR